MPRRRDAPAGRLRGLQTAPRAPETAMLPVLMVTASVAEKAKAIEAGADDPIAKPFNQDEMLRPGSVTASDQALPRHRQSTGSRTARAESIARRTQAQVQELERMRKLRRFLSSQPRRRHRLVGRRLDPAQPPSQGRDVLRRLPRLDGFVDTVEPEELMQVLGEFHRTIGGLVRRFDATVGFLEGMGSASLQRPHRGSRRRLERCGWGVRCARRWKRSYASVAKRGYELDFGAGIALGYATCGEVGFESRSDYAAIGAVTNLASRLADEAGPVRS